MGSELISVALGVLIGIIVTGLYGLTTTAVRKRVTIRSPEAKAISQLVPAVNALMETNGPMMQGIIAILEAQQGQCNGNVDDALKVNRAAKTKFYAFLVGSAQVGL